MILSSGEGGRHAVRAVCDICRGRTSDRARIRRVGRRANGAVNAHARRPSVADPRRLRAVALYPVSLAEGGAMTRTHRAWHRTIWIILAIIVGTGFALALALRPAPA